MRSRRDGESITLEVQLKHVGTMQHNSLMQARSRSRKEEEEPPSDTPRPQDAAPTIEELLSAPPEVLYGVSVQRVVAALACHDVKQVMQELWETNAYLELAVNADGEALGSLSLISYRVDMREGDGFTNAQGDWVSFTIDAEAFVSAFRSAEKSGVDFIWFNYWSYRAQPPWAASYDHEHFVISLATLMMHVDVVIWLPRARRDCKGQYQYRIWCTFEAAVVHLRGLPVIVAGHDLTAIQWALAAWGSYLVLPPWWLDKSDPVTALATNNLAFYLLVATTVAFYATYLQAGVVVYVITVGLGALLAAWLLWKWRRNDGLQWVLACNGHCILIAMITAASGVKTELSLDLCTRCMPWLPAYDRRDIVTAYALLTHVAGHLGKDASRHVDRIHPHAVILSVYYAALLMRSPGDDPKGRSPRVWLREIGCRVYAERQLSLLSSRASSITNEAAWAEWLDTPAPMDSAPMNSAPKDSAPNSELSYPQPDPEDLASIGTGIHIGDRLSTRQLWRVGWNVLPGLNDAIVTPAGSFWVANRPRGATARAVHGVARVVRRRLLRRTVTPLFLLISIVFVFIGILEDLGVYRSAPLEFNSTAQSQPQICGQSRTLEVQVCEGSLIVFAVYLTAALLFLLLALLADDLREYCSKRPVMPFPPTLRLEVVVLVYLPVSVVSLLQFFNSLGQIGSANTRIVLYFRALVYVMLPTVVLYLIHPAVIHSLAAAIRHRSLRYVSYVALLREEGSVKIL